jgi:uracil-DNA glycosylase
MDGTENSNELQVLLDWYRDMGVTHVLDEIATDWCARGNLAPGKGFRYPDLQLPQAHELPPALGVPPRQTADTRSTATEFQAPAPPPSADSQPPPTRQAPDRTFPTAAPDQAATTARTQASTAHSLADLHRLLTAFDGCALKATAKNLCFYRGAAKARLMVIGEAPGRDEDLAGKPFVGPAGQLLDRMLAAIGINEEAVHITNIVYWRPPGNRTPTAQEALICRPFLDRHIELVAPEFILLLGGAAAKHMLDTPDGIMKVRGVWRLLDMPDRSIRTMASLHPAYLLRTPLAKRQAWQDLLAIQIALDAQPG